MTEIHNILFDNAHRPFELPGGEWKYYQEWKDVLFFHWSVPFDVLRTCVPKKFNIDTFDGNCYVSLVAFTMQKIRPRYLPSISFISDFHEINLRTYISNDNKMGIYFLSVEAEKLVSTFLSKFLSGIPYEKSNIKRTDREYMSINSEKGFYLDAEFEVKQKLYDKSKLDRWLTERYCLYFDNNNEYYRYDIHHKEWDIKSIAINRLNLSYKIGDTNLSDRQPHLSHYSDGVKVLVWQRQKM